MASSEPVAHYTPQLRTALVLTGTGTAGAYHAGALRALSEAGVKIDLIAGRGVGAVGALFGAIDAGARLWEADGLWRSAPVRRLYRWRRSLRVACWMLAVAFAAVGLPVLVLAGAVIAFPIGYFLGLVGLDAGATIATAYAGWLDAVFAPTGAPSYLPPLVVVVVAFLLGFLVTDALATAMRPGARRRARGGFWWRLLGTPLDQGRAVEWFAGGLWRIMRGAARIATPSHEDLGQRYVELLADNLGDRGFREILVLAHDVDARRDIVFALLTDAHRSAFFGGRTAPDVDERLLETVDLVPAARHAVDAVAGALSVPVITDPRLVTFAPDSAWRGETHRLCDRFDGMSRLLDDVARAGAEQVIVVSAIPRAAGPHALGSDRRDIRGRAGQYLVGLETAALRDAVASRRDRFEAVFEVRPDHNPLGPFDFGGCYDERSDRRHSLAELVDRGYEDASRQFVDAVVGESGESIDAPPGAPRSREPSLSERLAAHGSTTD